MRLKGSSCIYFEYELSFIKLYNKKQQPKNLNWVFEAFKVF